MKRKPKLTTAAGAPVVDNQNTMTAGRLSIRLILCRELVFRLIRCCRAGFSPTAMRNATG